MHWILIGLLWFVSFSLPGEANSSTPFALAAKATKQQRYKSKILCPLIVLDAGHGGNDEGAKVHRLAEKKVTLLTAFYTKRYLEELGYRVLLTRGKDAYLSLPKRVTIANSLKCALFVSIHFNACKNPDVEGVEIFYYPGSKKERVTSSRKLASYMLHHVLDQTGAVSRGVKGGNLHVIRETDMPAVLVEAGFMTNRAEWTNIRNKKYLERIAKGIALGVDRYIKS